MKIKLRKILLFVISSMLFLISNGQIKSEIKEIKFTIIDSIIIPKANKSFPYLHKIRLVDNYLVIDNRPFLIYYNPITKKIFSKNYKFTFSHEALTGFEPLDTLGDQFIGQFSVPFFNNNQNRSFGIFDFNLQKQVKSFYNNNPLFVTENREVLEPSKFYEYSIYYFVPFYNRDSNYVITSFLKTSNISKSDTSLYNFSKLYNEKKQPQFYNFNFPYYPKDSFMFFDYFYPHGFAKQNKIYFSYGFNNIINEFDIKTNVGKTYNCQPSFLTTMHFFKEKQISENRINYTEYTYLQQHKNNFIRIVRLPSPNYFKLNCGVLIMDSLFNNTHWGLLPVGCNQLQIIGDYCYVINQNKTRSDTNIHFYKCIINYSNNEIEKTKILNKKEHKISKNEIEKYLNSDIKIDKKYHKILLINPNTIDIVSVNKLKIAFDSTQDIFIIFLNSNNLKTQYIIKQINAEKYNKLLIDNEKWKNLNSIESISCLYVQRKIFGIKIKSIKESNSKDLFKVFNNKNGKQCIIIEP